MAYALVAGIKVSVCLKNRIKMKLVTLKVFRTSVLYNFKYVAIENTCSGKKHNMYIRGESKKFVDFLNNFY